MMDYNNTPCYQVFSFDDHLAISDGLLSQILHFYLWARRKKNKSLKIIEQTHILTKRRIVGPRAPVTQIKCRGGGRRLELDTPESAIPV